MNHAVWKLAALGVVVAVGVGVVIHAQRGMQTEPPADEEQVAATQGEDGRADDNSSGISDEPPEQSEPDLAPDDLSMAKAVPASAKVGGQSASSRTNSRLKRQPDDGATAIERDDDRSAEREGKLNGALDPFEDDSDVDGVPVERPRSPAAGKTTADSRHPAIDIVDIDDDRDSELDRAADEKLSAAREAPGKKPRTAPSRGPVLTLDDPDDADGAESTASRREANPPTVLPRMSRTPSSSPARPVAADQDSDDPFSDEEPAEASAGPARIEPDEMVDDLTEPEIAPHAPPKIELPPKSKPARGLNVDDPELEREETPMDEAPPSIPAVRKPAAGPGLPAPDGSIEPDEDDQPPQLSGNTGKRPATLGRTIEPDGSDERSAAAPERIGLGPTRNDGRGAARHDFPSLPDMNRAEDAAPPANSFAEDQPSERTPAPVPRLTIEKLAPPKAVLGRPMVYDIQIRNEGPTPAYQVVVEDAIPKSVKLDGSIPQALLKGNRLIWKLGNLPGGAEKKISVRVVPQVEGTVGSVATVNFSAEPQAALLTSGPQLKFDVEAPRKAVVGTPIDFKFRVKNLGKTPATGVVIRDVLPAALRHPDGDDLEYEIGALPAGKEREIVLTLTAAQAGPTTNRVVVTAEGNVAEEAEVRLDVVGPALKVVRTGPKRLYPEKTGNYGNTVTNPGQSIVTGVTVMETVPAGMEFVEASDGGNYDAGKRTITWTIGRLAPDESQTVKVKLRSSARGPQISVVRAVDPNGASGETVGATQVSGVPALSIEVGELPPLIETGDTVTVNVRVINRGSDVAGNVRANVLIPPGMKLVSATGPVDHREVNTGGGQDAPAGVTVEFAPISKVDPRADATFELTLKARIPGEARLKIETRCDQLAEPIRREEVATIVAPE